MSTGNEKATTRDHRESWGDTLAGAVHAGITQSEVMGYYSRWADSYDQDVTSVRYNPPQIGATEVANLCGPETRDVRILDCAAGTGLVGYHLHKMGFTRLDALDCCQDMLDKAKEKNVYQRFICDFMGINRLAIEDNTYDIVVSVGSFCEGHVKPDCMPELIRITKPGGWVVLAVNEEYLHSVPILREHLEPTMQQLADAGHWVWITRKLVDNYLEENKGVVYIFKVL